MSKENKEEKKKKRKARAVLLIFLKKLQGTCGTFAKAEEWDKFIKENLVPILQEFEDAIPADWKEKLQTASKLKDKTKEGVDFACRVLQKNVKGLIKYLPKGGIFGNPLFKFLIGVAAGGTVAATILNTIAVSVVIKNQGCDTIYPSVYSFVKIPGLSLPNNPIADGESGIANLPPIRFTVESSGNNIKFSALGIKLNFQMESAGIDLIFNGNSLIGKRSDIFLKGRQEHEIVVVCQN